MTDDIFDPLGSASSEPVSLFPSASPDSPFAFSQERKYESPVTDLSSKSSVQFSEPEDPLSVRIGYTHDPMQLDTDPFGSNTVEWGRANGETLGTDYVKSANVFGKNFSREQLEKTEHGRKLLDYMEANRAGRRRGFLDAITDWQPSDAPFLGLFASVGKSIEDAIDVSAAMRKIQNGEPITDDEAVKTRLYFAEQEYAGNGTWGATVGDIVRAAPGFMVEFWGSGKLLSAGSKALAGAAESSPNAAAHLSIDRMTKYATRDAVESAFVKAFREKAGNATSTAIREGWQSLSDDAGKGVMESVRSEAMKAVKPMFEAQFAGKGELAAKVAESRIGMEIADAVARNSHKAGILNWANGTWQAARDHASRAILDFGNFGTELYSHSGAEINSAMKTLGDAFGILGIEAPLRGAMIMAPQQLVVKPAVNAIYGADTPSNASLSLQAAALRTGNRDLMASAESIAMGINFLEYASESSGAGFGKLFRAAGLGIFGGKAMGEGIEATAGLIPREVTEACGSRLRAWINKAVGTTDDFLKGHMANQIAAVRRKVGDGVADDAIETFIRTGDAGVLGDAASAVGSTPARKFVNDAVRDAIRENEMNMTYRGYLRYVLSDVMARNHFGPEEMTKWLKTAGYDGIVEEMMEERYSDFAKGLLGLDDRSAKDKGFVKNIEQAIRNLNPGWEQLTAEAVGFAVPMGIRTAVFQVQRAAGGSDLSFVQNYASTEREFRGANNVVEAKGKTHFAVAESAIADLKTQRDEAQRELDAKNEELRKRGATEDFTRQQTAELTQRISDLGNKIDVAERQVSRQRTVQGAAGYNAEQIQAFEAVNTRGESETAETPDNGQAKRAVTAQNVLVTGAARAGEILYRTQESSLDPKTMPFWKRAAARVAGFVGGLVTGDLGMAMYDPAKWSMVDRGMNRLVVQRLSDSYGRYFSAAKEALAAKGEDVTNDAVRRAMDHAAYEREAQGIMTAYLAAQGIRVFSANEMEAQARRVVEERFGTAEGHEADVAEARDQIAEYTLRILSNGSLQSADARDIARGIINISDDSPFKDDKILDATMRLAGFRGLEHTVELRPESDLREAVRGRSVSGKTIQTIAAYDPANLTAEQQAIVSDVASQLGYRPTYGQNGRTVLAFSEEAIAEMNKKVVNLCRLAAACSNRNIRTYRATADKQAIYADTYHDKDGNAHRRSSVATYIRVGVDDKGFYWVERDAAGNRVTRRAATEAELDAEMAAKGYAPSSNDVVFTPAREIRTKSAAVMLEKLGLTERYIAMQIGTTAAASELASKRLHPAFRTKADGKTRLTVDEWQRLEREEVSSAVRYRAVMSLSDEAKMRQFAETQREMDAIDGRGESKEVIANLQNAVRERVAAGETNYRNVFGSEQEKNGYMETLDRLLSGHGVQLPGRDNRSYTRYLTGDTSYYTLNTRLLNYNEGSSYVLVDLDRDVDYDGAIVSRAITNGLMSHRDMWEYNRETKSYPPFATAIRDVVKRMAKVGYDLADQASRDRRFGEAKTMNDLVDSLVAGTNLNSPKIDTVVWLARNAVLGQAEREAAKSKSTTDLAAASAKLATAVQQTPEFYPFLGFVDLVLGGDGFSDSRKAAEPAQFGVAALARILNGSDAFSMKDLLTRNMLPVKQDGTRMSVPEFMDKINKAIAYLNKKGADEKEMEKAAADDPMRFVAEIMRQAKLRTVTDLRDFMGKVLTAAGVNAGNTADLSGWRSDIASAKADNSRKDLLIAALTQELADRDAEIERLRKANASLAEMNAAQERRDEVADELNAAKNAPKSAVPEATVTPETDNSPLEPEVDISRFGHDDTIDDFSDMDGNEDEGPVLASYDVETPHVEKQDDVFVGSETSELSPEATRHLVWTVTKSLDVLGLTADDFRRHAHDLFPCLSDADLDNVLAEFGRTADAVNRDKKDAIDALSAVKEFMDGREDQTSDSDGWTDKAVAAYNSLKPMLEMMEVTAPVAKRNFQGLVTVLRDEVDAKLAQYRPADGKEPKLDEVGVAYQKMWNLLNPRMLDIRKDGATVPERMAAHVAVIDRYTKGEDLDSMIRAFSRVTTLESGIRKAENQHLAAFLSFLGSLDNEGVRRSIMLLVSSSSACDAVAIDNVYKKVVDENDPTSEGTTVATGEREIKDSVTSRGSVSVNMVSEAFLPLSGTVDVNKFGTAFRAASDAALKNMTPIELESGPFALDEDDGHTIVGVHRKQLLQYFSVFRKNAAAIAEAFDTVFGRNNPLSAILTSSMVHSRFVSTFERSDDYAAIKRMYDTMQRFCGSSVKGDRRPDAVQTVASILNELFDQRTKHALTRDDIVNTVQNAFTTGHLQHGKMSFPGADASLTNEWLTLFNEFVQSMPDTVVPSKPVKGRTEKDSSVAVAARGMIPIVTRYMTSDSDGDFSFRSICERIVREDAERDYWIEYGERRYEEKAHNVPRYVDVTGNAKDYALKPEEKAEAEKGLAKFVEDRIASLGGIDGIVLRCVQTSCWPDAAKTPIVARNLSVDYSPVEMNDACRYTYDAEADRRAMWYVPLFGGDHACNNLLQLPVRRLAKNGKALGFLEAAKAINDELGVSLMMTDTKRSAITSADAAAIPMVGADVQFTPDGLIGSVKTGECRLHVAINFATESGRDFSQEAMHGQTLCAGFGPDALRRMAKDPKLRISKFHEIGTGRNLSFEKSASSIVDSNSLRDGGAFAPGTMPRAYADYLLKYRSDESRKSSSDSITDEDSYKVGPLKSKTFQVALAVDGDKCTKSETLLDHIKRAAQSGVKLDAILAEQVQIYNPITKELSEPMALSASLDGLEIAEMPGLNQGDRKENPAFVISYRDNSMMALKVANIAHNSKPEVGTNGKNYTVDALTKAIEQSIRRGDSLDSPACTMQNQVLSTLNAYAVMASAVATDPASVEAELKGEPRLQSLLDNGADPDGMEFRKLRAEVVAKRIRKSVLSPVNKIDAVLTSCGATLDADGTVLDHSLSEMRRDVHRGSVVLSDGETGEGGLYRGFKRMFALAEVNVKDTTFRYGMFLNAKAAGFAEFFGATQADWMDNMERHVTEIHDLDKAYDLGLKTWKMSAEYRENRKAKRRNEMPEELSKVYRERLAARDKFFSFFLDHHGTAMNLKRFVLADGSQGPFYCSSVSLSDLFTSDGKDGSRFDRTAFRMGDDGVHLDVYDYETGARDEAKSSTDKLPFLAGTAFGVPRTPSYNGGMWLQVARASFPVTEVCVNGNFQAGDDALVALDPQTLDILGCDNDGDESALYMLSPDGVSGYAEMGDIAAKLPQIESEDFLSTYQKSLGSELDTKENREAMLSEVAKMSETGVRYVARGKDGGFEFTPRGKKAVSNQLVDGLFSMAHDLEVPPGTGRRNFASEISGRTKAQPFDDGRYWKRDRKEAPGFEGVTRLMDLMPPDIFTDATSTIGDPNIQMAVALSAKKSSQARGAIVQAASSLHLAFASGCFTKGMNFELFDTKKFSPEAWQAFMRHFDGLSNATFDDVKERICKRLGLTPEMIDTLVVDLLSHEGILASSADADKAWYDALKKYILSVRDAKPDGSAVWNFGIDREIGPEDISRMFMAKVSDRFDETWYRRAQTIVFGNAVGREQRTDAVLKYLGLTMVDDKVVRDLSVSIETPRGRIGKFMVETGHAKYVATTTADPQGRDMLGYVLWLTGAAYGNLAAARDGSMCDLAHLGTVLQANKRKFTTYVTKRMAWKTAKDFASALNFSQSDPGAQNARSKVARMDKAYDAVLGDGVFAKLSKDQRKFVVQTRAATKMAYSCGMVNAETPDSRAFNAAESVKEDPNGNAGLARALEGQGSPVLSDFNDVVSVISDCSANGDVVRETDRDTLRTNVTSVPYVIAALQCLPKTGLTKDYETARKVFAAIADGAKRAAKAGNEYGSDALWFRRGVESMFRIYYALIATSNEGLRHPGITYLGMRSDSSYNPSKRDKSRREKSWYNIGESRLGSLFQTFSVRDAASMKRVRAAIGEIVAGTFDNLERATTRYKMDNGSFGASKAKSFCITDDNIFAISAEGTGGTFSNLTEAKVACYEIVRAIAAATGADVKDVRIAPSEFFTQILPVYMAATQPVAGTPTYEQFSGSILAVMPELYRSWSAQQAKNDRALGFMADKYQSGETHRYNFIDGLAVLNWAPVNVSATAKAWVKANSGKSFSDARAALSRGETVDGVRPVRSNPENRTLVDFLARDGVLFKAARIADEFGAEAPVRQTGPSPVVSSSDLATPTETAADSSVTAMADSLRQAFGAVAGFNVEVDGNTLVIRGTLQGEKALKKRGINAPVNTVIRVDVCPNGFGRNGADLNSEADAVSITNALREAGIADITPEEFLTKMTLAERKALVEKVMPDAMSDKASGYSLRTPYWSIDSKGIYTLAGAIKLRKSDSKTMYHEYFHSMLGMMNSLGMFSEADVKALRRTYGEARGSYELFNEEAAANGFAAYVSAKKPTSKTGAAAFFQKMYDFLKTLVDVLRNRGFHYNESVKAGDRVVKAENILFNLMLSGTVMDSLDSPKFAKARLAANRKVQADLLERRASDAVDESLTAVREDRFDGNRKDDPELLADIERGDFVSMRNRLTSLIAGKDVLSDVHPVVTALSESRDFSSGHVALSYEDGHVFAYDVYDDLGSSHRKDLGAVSASEFPAVRAAIDSLPSVQSTRWNVKAADPMEAAKAALAAKRAAKRAGVNAGDTVPSTVEKLTAEVQATLGEAVAPGDGINGDSPYGVGRLQRLSHGVAQAIAQGLDAIDPAVRGLIESNSDLSKFALGEEINNVVARGIFVAARTLGVDIKAKDAQLKNMVYANMLSLYWDISKALGYGGKRNPIRHARQNKGKFTEQKNYVSRYDIGALLLTSGGLSYRDIATDAINRLTELSDVAERTSPDLKRNVEHLLLNLRRIVNKTSYKGDPMKEIMAGTMGGELDPVTNEYSKVEPKPDERIRSGERTAARRNKDSYQFGNPVFQEAFTTAARTAHLLSAAKKLYRILGIEPTTLTGEEIPGGRGKRVRVLDRRTGQPAQEPVAMEEVTEALSISIEDLMLDGTVVDPFAEVGLYVNNPGEWLASTVRKSFGGKPLRDMFQEEHSRLKGLTDRFRRKMNWWAMYLGENAVENTPLLAVRKDKGHFVFDNGTVAYDETGHERTGFDNYSRRAGKIGKWRGITTDVTLDRSDKEMIDIWMKSAYSVAMGDRYMLTGIDGISFTFKDIVKANGAKWTKADFAKDKVLAAYNSSYVGRQKNKAVIALAQLLSEQQLPDAVVNGGYNLYDKVVDALVDAFNTIGSATFEDASGIQPADVNEHVLKFLASRGVLRYRLGDDGKPVSGTFALDNSVVENMFHFSKAREKLIAAGRDPEMLTTRKLVDEAMSTYAELLKEVRKTPWMYEGDGRYFNQFGTYAPFFAGNGVYMYYAKRIGRDEKKDISQRLNEYEESFSKTLQAADGPMTLGQATMLCDLFGVKGESGSRFLSSVRNGDYEDGKPKSLETGLVIGREDSGSMHRVAEVIYRRLCAVAWEAERNGGVVKKLGGRGSVARMIDMYEQLVGERTSWGSVGMGAEQMYQMDGTLPANYQIFHAINVSLEDAARTMQFRNTFVNFLFTADERGNPLAYAKPSLVNRRYVDDGIPEAVWEYAARWWAEANGKAYDESQSGRVNAARLYDEIIASNATKTVNGRHFRMLDGESRQGLTSVSDFAAVDDDAMTDDVNARNSVNGGETYGYAKMLFNIKRVVGGKAQSMLMNRVANYSKTLSVQQSAFFPIATKLESPAAAVGFWTMVMSNFAPGTARKLDKQIAKFDSIFKTGFGSTLNRNFIGFRDIIEMMDTDDPFLAEAIDLCDAIGISLSDRLMNPYESDKAIVEADKNRVVAFVRNATDSDEAAKFVSSMLDGLLFRGSERAFGYALNATKIATALQLSQKVRQACHAQGRAFNFVREMKPYAAYLNAEIGGIDPYRYAWADPRFRRLMNGAMFSWEWTKGAWAAGGGEILEEALGGGHFTNPETRAHMMGRWLRMYGTIMIGVPLMMQFLVKLVSKLFGGYDGDDDDKWFTWENEEKHNLSAFNITPLLKTLAKSELVLKAKDIPVLGNLVPAYTGKDDYNTTGARKYYMHFGKQGWEFFRWFTDGDKQFLSKLSMPLQRMIEGLLGYNPASREYDLPFSKMSLAERWLNPTVDGALWNMAKAYVPFSWNAMSSYGDAGAISVLGPVSMGKSYMASIKDAQAKLTAWAKNDRKGYSYGYYTGKNRKRNVLVVRDILHDAKTNGMDPKTILTEATGLAAKSLYAELYALLPKSADDEVDVREIARVARGLNRLNVVQSQLFESMKAKLERHNLKWSSLSAEQKVNIRSAIKSAMRNPYSADDELYEAYRRDDYLYPEIGDEASRQAANGGDALSNFLATDDVPPTLFGFEVVSKDYTEKDLEFFREFPEAGGYYDLGDEEPEEPPPQGGGSPGGGATGAQGGGETSDTDAVADKLNAAIDQAIPFIKEHEGFRDKAYKDSVGKWTIGYGQTEIDGRPVRKGDTIDEETASKFVERRVRDNAVELYKNTSWANNASANALAALYDLAYNMGVGALSEEKSPTLNSTGRAATTTNDVDAAIWAQVPTYIRAGGKVVKGLKNRRQDAIDKWRK